MCHDICESICVKLDVMINTTKLYSFDSTLNDLDVHSRPQGYLKAKSGAVILL